MKHKKCFKFQVSSFKAMFRTTGIVLLKRDFREHDRIYTIYTYDHGKIEALGRGTRKIISKLASHLEPPSVVDLLIVRGKVFDHIAGVERLEEFSTLRSDLARLLEFARIAGIFDHEVKLEHKDNFLYDLLYKFISNLNSAINLNISELFLNNLVQYTNYGVTSKLKSEI